MSLKCYTHNDVEAVGACTACGKALCASCALYVDDKMVCKECAERMASSKVAAGRKEPFLALLLSLLGGVLTGSLLFSLGQLYNGQPKKFIALTILNMFIGFIALGLYILGAMTIIGLLCCLPVFLLPIVLYLYELCDAYVTADRINRGEPVQDWFP